MDLRYSFTKNAYIVWSKDEVLAIFDKNLNIKFCRDLKKLPEIREELRCLILETVLERR